MTLNIFDENETKALIAHSMDNIENVSFKKHIIEFHANSIFFSLKRMSNLKKWILPDSILFSFSTTLSEEIFASYENQSLPSEIIEILDKALKKKEQIRLLKGCVLKESQLGTLFAHAEKKGYLFSHYKFKGETKGVEKDALPKFIHIKDDGSIEYWGETSLTEGQMRLIVEQAEVLIARIIDDGTKWHCFLQTFKGLKGKESGIQGSHSHIHYLSSSFGFSKEVLIDMLKRGEYPQSPVHIPLIKD